MTSQAGPSRLANQHQVQNQQQQRIAQSPLERSASRISTALSRIQSTEAYPPQDRDLVPSETEIETEIENGNENETGENSETTSENDLDEKSTPTKVESDQTNIKVKAKGNGKGKGHGINIDIEHVPVEDDPREWKNSKKWFAFLVVTLGLLGPIMAASIYNPVINDITEELHATESQTGLTLSMYILFQGWTPVVWAGISEPVYLTSFAIYIIALIVASRAKSMPLLIAMRALQATGSGAVTALGAGSLADMYEIHERGSKMGLYYGLPMLGPGVAPLLGGALGQAFGWRSVFYFLTAYAGVMFIAFVLFPDSWRRERSRVYQKAMSNATKRAEVASAKKEMRSERRKQKLAKGSDKLEDIPSSPPESRRHSHEDESTHNTVLPLREDITATATVTDIDIEQQPTFTKQGEINVETQNITRTWYGRKVRSNQNKEAQVVKLSFRDLNPLPTMRGVIAKPANSVLLTASGILFAAQYTTVYTASITLGEAPYNYNSLQIGLVLLAFGIGSIMASILGGRYSDMVLKRLKKGNGGVVIAEMRLKATFVAMPFLVLGFLAYAWTAEKKVHIAGIVISLVVSGFALLWIYSSTLAYLVDANPGISSSAVSLNSLFRGVMACVMSQIAVPIRNAIGDGGLYTLFAGLLALSSAALVLIAYRGEQWRSPDHKFNWKRSNNRKVEKEGI
ncbi:uncharacterized protein IL334_003519 [Kwoniella shivajii]|uniref:Major facilitator superfamily (MFS) profile domain-containing protein n=1 Tax=Kwoniella shivajii TaxID=564305 RepID=A0ABZ1CZG6_9TREE|nr:hypothetical protein IL334_003519 [Kwoniella shivajii]